MRPMKISTPFDNQLDPQVPRFATHANYLRAFASIGGFRDMTSADEALRGLATEAHRVFASIPKTDKEIAIEQIKRSLTRAWGTELLLNLNGKVITEDELKRLANNWSVVQAYYVFYHATQALAGVKVHQRAESHPTTQRIFASFWTVPDTTSLSPFTLGFGAMGPKNAPENVAIKDKINTFSRCSVENHFSLAVQALRTTRRVKLPQLINDARKQNKATAVKDWEAKSRERELSGKSSLKTPNFTLPLLTAAEKAVIEEKLRPYSLMDYLFRLRVKTNYQDSAMFTDGPRDELVSTVVHNDLEFLTAGMLLVHEVLISKLVGPEIFESWAQDWLKTSPGLGRDLGLARRMELIFS